MANRIPAIFKQNALFAGFDEKQLLVFFSLLQLVKVMAGNLIIKEGERSNELYLIEQGEVEVCKNEAGQNRQHRLTTLQAGDCFA